MPPAAMAPPPPPPPPRRPRPYACEQTRASRRLSRPTARLQPEESSEVNSVRYTSWVHTADTHATHHSFAVRPSVHHSFSSSRAACRPLVPAHGRKTGRRLSTCFLQSGHTSRVAEQPLQHAMCPHGPKATARGAVSHTGPSARLLLSSSSSAAHATRRARTRPNPSKQRLSS